MKRFVILAGFCLTLIGLGKADAQKMAYIDMQNVISSMPETAQVDTALNKYQQQLYEQYQQLQKDLQQQAEAFIKDSLNMSDVVKKVKRGTLQDMSTRIQQFRQSINQRTSQKYDELMQPVIDKAKAAASSVAKAKGVSWVINDIQQGDIPLLVVKPASGNLTAAVKAQLGIKQAAVSPATR